MKPLFFAAIAFSLMLSACGDNTELKEENERLRALVQKDSALLAEYDQDMIAVDEALNEAMQFDMEMSSTEGLANRADILKKIGNMRSMLEENSSKISELESELSSSKSRYSSLARSLNAKKAALQAQLDNVAELEKRVQGLQAENIDLQATIAARDSTIAERNQEIQLTAAELEAKRLELQQTVAKAEEDAARAKQEVLNIYLTMGNELLADAEEVKGRKARIAAATAAFDYFCKAHQGGLYEAKDRLNYLRAHKKLGKFVEDKEDCTK